jgi:cell wall-associated NlpC family hydrolase
MITKHVNIITAICLLLLTVLTSCHTSKQATAYRSAKQPKFIGDIYMNGHNKSNTTVEAIKPTVKTEKPKRNPKPTITPSPAPAPVTTEDVAVMETKHAVSNDEEPIEMGPDPKKLKKKYAEIIGVRPKEIDNYALYKFIDKWYGTNYRLGGCDESGIDCSGFAQKLYGSVYGVDLLRTAMEQFKNCRRIKKPGDAEEGDLVFFKQHSKRITHVGVYLANNYFVHASTSQGVTISNLNDEYWHKHYAGMGRISD